VLCHNERSRFLFRFRVRYPSKRTPPTAVLILQSTKLRPGLVAYSTIGFSLKASHTKTGFIF